MLVLGKVYTDNKNKYRLVKKVLCDKCKKELSSKLYAYIAKCHSRWGEDSWESTEEYNVCFACAKKMFNAFVAHHKDTDDFECEARETKELKSPLQVMKNGQPFVSDRECIIEED